VEGKVEHVMPRPSHLICDALFSIVAYVFVTQLLVSMEKIQKAIFQVKIKLQTKYKIEDKLFI